MLWGKKGSQTVCGNIQGKQEGSKMGEKKTSSEGESLPSILTALGWMGAPRGGVGGGGALGRNQNGQTF